MPLDITAIQQYKNKQKIIMLTAYDYLFAKLLDQQVDILLVGDSLNMIFGGQSDTINLSLEAMIYHCKAVCTARKNALVVADMPFGSYTKINQGLKNAVKIYKQCLVDAVKLEGAKPKLVKALTCEGIAVMAHLGITPQGFRKDGYKIKGKNKDQYQMLLDQAQELQAAGAFAIVLEGIKASAARDISKALSIPTIGIGSGNGTDGQVLVLADLLGLFEDFKPKFVKHYLNGASLVKEAVAKYKQEVQTGIFPSNKESY